MLQNLFVLVVLSELNSCFKRAVEFVTLFKQIIILSIVTLLLLYNFKIQFKCHNHYIFPNIFNNSTVNFKF